LWIQNWNLCFLFVLLKIKKKKGRLVHPHTRR
jgi:hypothetical protein